MSKKYYIRELKITNLWGHRKFTLSFNNDVNIIIGPNASGKTTILNLIRYIFTSDFAELRSIEFDKVEIRLRSFDEKSNRKIFVETTETGFRIYISNRLFEVEVDPRLSHDLPFVSSKLRRLSRYRFKYPELDEALKDLVDAVWLPVSRRLPIPEEEEVRPTSSQLESVDVRLRDLFKELQTYRLGLEQKLSIQYKDFEKKVLREILYSKEYDQLGSLSMEMPKSEDKEQLLRAFQVAGLLDSSMKKRIDEHFNAANQAIKDYEKFNSDRNSENRGFPITFLFIMPLIRRTKSIVNYARSLEEDRNKLFEPLQRFEANVNSYLEPKTIVIGNSGNVTIYSPDVEEIFPYMLSSGEKQILILLIQALVREAEPVIYVADEPELSLHVTWQEKLLTSLTQLTKQAQIIVATHSPDIVGPYTDNVIDLGKML